MQDVLEIRTWRAIKLVWAETNTLNDEKITGPLYEISYANSFGYAVASLLIKIRPEFTAKPITEGPDAGKWIVTLKIGDVVREAVGDKPYDAIIDFAMRYQKDLGLKFKRED